MEDWRQAQAWLDEQQRTNWLKEFNDLLTQVHPLHPGHLGRLPVAYNWTVHQSEWATDVAFRSRQELETWYARWTHYAFENFTTTQVLRFLGRSGRVSAESKLEVHSDVQAVEESVRLKHWVNGNSVKMYDHSNVLWVETTVNEAKEFKSYRSKVGDAGGAKSWRVLRKSVADTHRRAEVSQATNERYLEALAAVAATTTVAALTVRWCKAAEEPGESGRKVRAFNPLSEDDAALLKAVSDPKWSLNGIRNRDLAEALFGPAPQDEAERRRRSSKVGRLLRLLRAHGIMHKVAKTHLYRVCESSRDGLLSLVVVRQADLKTLTALAA